MFVNVKTAKTLIKQGKVIAYPTEAVFGLGCNPFDNEAISRLLALKKRDDNKGFILIISSLSQLKGLICPTSQWDKRLLEKYWPGPTTFLFPKHPDLAKVLTGQYETIAIRLTSHPIAHALCIDAPLISTSANLSGDEALKTKEQVLQTFSHEAVSIVDGEVGLATKPSTIIDIISGAVIRA